MVLISKPSPFAKTTKYGALSAATAPKSGTGISYDNLPSVFPPRVSGIYGLSVKSLKKIGDA